MVLGLGFFVVFVVEFFVEYFGMDGGSRCGFIGDVWCEWVFVYVGGRNLVDYSLLGVFVVMVGLDVVRLILWLFCRWVWKWLLI